jgi:hypothetical protein
VVVTIPTRPWLAVQFDGQSAVRCEHDPVEWCGYAGLDETDGKALAKLLNQVGVR